MEQILNSYLEYLCGKDNISRSEPLFRHTTFKIGGKAKFFVRVDSKPIMLKLLSALDYIEEPYFIIGNGSNILAPDRGFDGVVIKPTFNQILENGNFIYADAGASLSAVLAFAKKRGLGGLEWAAGIPATVGGAVYMNAGAYGCQMSDVTMSVDILYKGQVINMESSKLKFDYRTSIFHSKRDWAILGAYFYLTPRPEAEIERLMRENIKKRRTKQPIEPSAGSSFKRPRPDFYVGAAIEEIGLKGKQIGGARISEKHAGFIVNMGGAKCADVLKLSRLIQKEVYTRYGEKLELEYERPKPIRKIQPLPNRKKPRV